MDDLVIVGAGGHARETLDVVDAVNASAPRLRVLGFVDDDPTLRGVSVRGYPVLGDAAWLRACDPAHTLYLLGIGAAGPKARLGAALAAAGFRAPVLVHPRAVHTPLVTFGPGSVLAAGAMITSDVRLGTHVYVNVGASISHDCVVGDYCHLAPGSRLAGSVTLGAGCEIGIGAVVMQGITIGPGTIVGAGAAVVRDLPPRCVAAGVPARVLRERPVG